MCGIAGLLLPDREAGRVPAAARVVRRMGDLQRHRGPDDRGAYSGPGIALDHQRLSILDLSPRGRQPMQLAGTPYWIVHNGEVYNYRELRAELEPAGFRFRSETDTEVILAAYAQWGAACLERFNGMFAFAIWDEREAVLFCARDRLGIKPFHYVELPDGTLAFASEIKAFHALPDFTMAPHDGTVARFIGHALCNATPETCIAGVRTLPAGHWMRCRPGERASPRAYWDLPGAVRARSAPAEADPAGSFRDALVDSVRLRLRSDVPVGTCLSGGLDSSTLVVTVHRLLAGVAPPPRQATFSACFDEPALDERAYMRAVSARARTEPHEVFPSAEGLGDDLQRLIWQQDEPFGSTSIFAQWCVFRRARAAGVPVTLDGQGADELLGGYDAYPPTYFHQLARAGAWSRCWRECRRYARLRELPLRRVLRRTRSRGRGPDRRRPPSRYLHPDLHDAAAPPGRPPAAPDSPFDPFRAHLCRDLTATLLPSLLRYEDRNAMAFGVESRVPFLDHRLVEWVFTLPAEALLRDGWTKRLLRDAFEDLLPPEVAWRRDKLAFQPPEAAWFRRGLGAHVRDLVARPAAPVFERYVDHPTFAAAWRRFEAGGSYRGEFWRVLNLSLWLDGFVSGQLSPESAWPDG